VTASSAAHKAGPGDFVQVHYTGTLDDNSVFDSSRGRDPLEFTVGGGMVIKGFDEAVTGLARGESRKARINPENAYGTSFLLLIVPSLRPIHDHHHHQHNNNNN